MSGRGRSRRRVAWCRVGSRALRCGRTGRRRDDVADVTRFSLAPAHRRAEHARFRPSAAERRRPKPTGAPPFLVRGRRFAGSLV
ncbi:hypothetical protein RR46_05337 [Papilio xuthus]|uniref:Uncharacterized protein n=1 Tax=Papilio xuthus TaxID=66420 RepID=A0A194Q6B5_PAPXU|nr:hypothetical protein RR46_05337 [Papilio xuthus]